MAKSKGTSVRSATAAPRNGQSFKYPSPAAMKFFRVGVPAKEFTKLAKPHPWPNLGRDKGRKACQALEQEMSRIADVALVSAWNAAFAKSLQLKYPRRVQNFMRMFTSSIKGTLQNYSRAAGMSEAEVDNA